MPPAWRAAPVRPPLNQVAQRYGRALGINGRDVTDALHAAREVLSKGTAAPASRRSGGPDGLAEADTAEASEASEAAAGDAALPG